MKSAKNGYVRWQLLESNSEDGILIFMLIPGVFGDDVAWRVGLVRNKQHDLPIVINAFLSPYASPSCDHLACYSLIGRAKRRMLSVSGAVNTRDCWLRLGIRRLELGRLPSRVLQLFEGSVQLPPYRSMNT